MVALKLTQVGQDIAVVLPAELAQKLGVASGDTLYARETSRGGVELSPIDPAAARQVAVGEALMDEYDETFRILAR